MDDPYRVWQAVHSTAPHQLRGSVSLTQCTVTESIANAQVSLPRQLSSEASSLVSGKRSIDIAAWLSRAFRIA